MLIELESNPVSLKASLIILIMQRLVLKHSEPPLRIVAFPDFRHKTAASEVTFGLDS